MADSTVPGNSPPRLQTALADFTAAPRTALQSCSGAIWRRSGEGPLRNVTL